MGFNSVFKVLNVFPFLMLYFDCDILYYKVKLKLILTKHSFPTRSTMSRCSPQQGRHKLMSTESSHLVLKRDSSNDTNDNYIILHIRCKIYVGQPSEYCENVLPTN